jgi:hypothetical protein
MYRLLVTASQLKAKKFVWVIVDDTNRGAPVQTSKQAFRSLEDAYNTGRGAQRKTRRTHPPVDLAQPPPAEQPVERAVPKPNDDVAANVKEALAQQL